MENADRQNDSAPTPSRGHGFSRRMRLVFSRQFDEVYLNGKKRLTGPFMVHALPNDLDHPRLGLSVPRQVGNAARRNRIKRLLREAFRLMQSDLPHGYDLVITVRNHEPLSLAEYQSILSKSSRSLHLEWSRKQEKPASKKPRKKDE